MPTLQLSQGRIDYRDEGTEAPVLVIDGLLVNGTAWRRPFPLLAPQARCILRDLPLGSHRVGIDLC